KALQEFTGENIAPQPNSNEGNEAKKKTGLFSKNEMLNLMQPIGGPGTRHYPTQLTELYFYPLCPCSCGCRTDQCLEHVERGTCADHQREEDTEEPPARCRNKREARITDKLAEDSVGTSLHSSQYPSQEPTS